MRRGGNDVKIALIYKILKEMGNAANLTHFVSVWVRLFGTS